MPDYFLQIDVFKAKLAILSKFSSPFSLVQRASGWPSWGANSSAGASCG
jgi:hypothetical protein